MKILLFGANGQLGSAFQDLSKTDAFPVGWTLVGLSSKECDLSDESILAERLEREKSDLVINTAAYTAVDRAEKEQTLCDAINARAPAVMAAYCKAKGIPLIHYSTDYVYEGAQNCEHFEAEAPKPQNVYGASKARGDEAVVALGGEHLIFRTSWVFSHVGKNFVNTMLKLGAEQSELRVVEDQFGAPTYAPDLAEYSLHALMRGLEQKAVTGGFPSGVYHLTNSGVTNWADFARAITPATRIVGISSSEYPTGAKRPLNSRLSLEKFTKAFGVRPRPWQEALRVCLERLKDQNG
ncbi:MAG: dTDP-4-dehydrorhamnose reductase [Bdellovibrionales bacterium]|nr:dTDP-4-dehydrorhamnose reductase [Bdellovibrionales bacterium]